jgi:hypothetical protein
MEKESKSESARDREYINWSKERAHTVSVRGIRNDKIGKNTHWLIEGKGHTQKSIGENTL